jgi:hypothetical protein
MQLFMRLNWDGGRAAAGLTQASAQVKRFTDGASKQFAGLRKQAHDLNTAMGGFSGITRLAGAYLGVQAARETLTKNMDFDKIILESKQLAEMTEEQAARMRKLALDLSKNSLSSPLENADAIRTLANAGMKYDEIESTLQKIVSASAVFRSTMKEFADLDFDLETKFKIAPEQLDAVHNMLYYHAKAGRFEAHSISSYAPQYLAAMNMMGFQGVQGTNFAGAILQALQKIKPQTMPSETVTLIEHGLSHLLNVREGKHLRQVTGIDIKKFAPGGKFKGADGLEGMFGLLEAMKKAGLDKDTFKLASVFRDKYEREFWQVILRDFDAIKTAMREGDQAAKNDQIATDYKEILSHPYAKVKGAENTAERAQLSGAATAGTSAYAGVLEYATGHPVQAGVGALGLFMAGRMAYNRIRNGKADGGAGGFADSAMGMAGVQRVFVVNMPGGMGGGGQLALPPGEGWSPAAAAQASRWAGALGAAKGALKWGAIPTALFAGYEAYGVAHNDQLNAEAKKTEYGRIAGGAAGSLGGAAIGAGIGSMFGVVGAIPGALIGGWLGNLLGEKAGQKAAEKIHLQTTIQLDGRVLAEQIREYNRDAGLRD